MEGDGDVRREVCRDMCRVVDRDGDMRREVCRDMCRVVDGDVG